MVKKLTKKQILKKQAHLRREARKNMLICRWCSKEIEKGKEVYKGKKEYHPACLPRMKFAARGEAMRRNNPLQGGLVNPR